MTKLIDKIRLAGIVGSGGLGLPIHLQLQGDIETIIINNAECEPLLQVDRTLSLQYSEAIVKGLHLLMKELHIKHGIIGVREKNKDVIKALALHLDNFENIGIHVLSNTYPVGDSLILVKEITGIVLKKGEKPISKKICVMNTETLLNIYNKVVSDQNVIDTYVSIVGEVENPGTYRLPIGLAIGECLNLAGLKTKNYSIIVGGPMTGQLTSINDVVRKNTKALIILEKNHPLILKYEDVNIKHLTQIMSTCSQCRICTDMCPRNLLGHKVEPHMLMNAMANGLMNNTSVLDTALGCVNCGICELYACPLDLSPRKMMMQVKKELMAKGIVATSSDSEKHYEEYNYPKVPLDRLILRLGLKKYDNEIPLIDKRIQAKQVRIPLKLSIGKGAMPIVKIGDKLRLNQLIARGDSKEVSDNLHASIKGTVTKISDEYIWIERN